MIELAPHNPYGLTLAHPLTAAGGFLGNVADVARPFGLHSSSAPAVALAVTRRVVTARGAGRAAQLVETPGGAVYRPAESDIPLRRVERELADAWAELAVPLLVAVSDEDGREVAAALDGTPGIAGFVLESGDTDPTRLQRSVEGLRRRSELPLIVQLTGLHGDLDTRAAAAAAGGADGLALLNGISAAAVDDTGRTVQGELIGPAAFPLVLASVSRLAGRYPLSLIAGGGVHHAAQVRMLLDAGAQAVSLDSLLWRGPGAVRALLEQLNATSPAT